MKQKELPSELNGLPPQAQRQVFDFIAFLRTRYGLSSSEKRDRKSRIEDEHFIGMWKNREDLIDSSEWVRGIRKAEWEK